jgi:molybdopterin-guanine dinucleotide biosynthesis protein A
MLRLPGHIPVVTVSNRGEVRAKGLFKKLQEALEKLGIRFSVIGPGVRFQSAAELIALLADTDMLFIDRGMVDSSACLLFAEPEAMPERADRRAFHCREGAEARLLAAAMHLWLRQCAAATPITGAVLIGGKSSRMGRPKHLIENQSGTTWLGRSLETVGSVTTDLVISGNGAVPDSLKNIERIADLPGLEGPLAGIGALFSSRPFTSWLIAACDMPYFSKAALDWILEQRRRDYWAVIPVNPKTGRNEPLLAWYDYRCGPVIEELIRSGSQRVSELCGHGRIMQPLIPDRLAGSWRNINYFDEIESS